VPVDREAQAEDRVMIAVAPVDRAAVRELAVRDKGARARTVPVAQAATAVPDLDDVAAAADDKGVLQQLKGWLLMR
jgi:hypothetical protein